MKTINIKLYEFKGLNGDAQEKAIFDMIDFEIDISQEESWLQDSFDKAEKLQTPWFTASIIYEDHKQDIIDNIEANEYLFFEDGELVPGSYYDQAV